MRIIKKYPNRRLYDTGASCYVTLGDLRQLVLEGETFHVRAARTGTDLTRSVLLQIITEAEQQGPALLSDTALLDLIRLQGTGNHAPLTARLEQILGDAAPAAGSSDADPARR